jgi:hypothetical protein
MKRFIYIIIFLITFSPTYLASQSYNLQRYSENISSEKLKSYVTFLADDLCRGRQTGSRGGQIAGSYIKEQFVKLGLKPLYGSFYQSFRKDSMIGRNICGVIEARYKTDEYIVISAHYDHLGAFEGNIYNGADDNASGVAVMLEIAGLYSKMSAEGEAPPKNIIFIAFDAKEYNMAGSEYFLRTLPFMPKKIKFVLNLDQIGSIFAPPGRSANYIEILGATGKLYKLRERIDYLNIYSGSYMDLDFTYYGSNAFASLFYKSSDHINFAERGIPALYFTSGITAHTYKPSDDSDLLDYNVMANRVKLIFFISFDIMNS